MNLQTVIVGTIVLLAFLYIGKSIWYKVKSFSATSTNTACGTGCGCDSKTADRFPVQVGKT